MNLKLKSKIAEKFGSQVAFAFKLEENEQLVSRVVRGWRKISDDKQRKWAKALNCKTEDIF